VTGFLLFRNICPKFHFDLSGKYVWGGTKVYLVDAFCNKAFSGNPAAIVFLDGHDKNDQWMQSFSTELNLSETAYLKVLGQNSWNLRWFTPLLEVDLCGHATLATVFTLIHTKRLNYDEKVTFHTRSGELTALVSLTNGEEFISMDFPAEPMKSIDNTNGKETILFKALGIDPTTVIFTGSNRIKDVLVHVNNEEFIKHMEPDFTLLKQSEARVIIVTAQSTSTYDGIKVDFISRVFAPCCGVNEDPVCGSAHCALGPYWSSQLSKKEVIGYQASKRGGIVRVRNKGERIDLVGQAKLIYTAIVENI